MRGAVAAMSLVLVSLLPAAQPAAAVETPIVLSPSVVDFGSVIKGTPKVIDVQVTNTGSTPFGPITIFGGAPPSVQFNSAQNCQSVTLAAGASCQIQYQFLPTYFGPAQDTSQLTISQTANQSDGEDFTIALKGRGVSPLAVTPTALDFGDVAVGSSAQRTVQVTNTTAAAVGPIAVGDGEPPSAAFGVTLTGCQAKTLAPGTSCLLTYTFAPTTAGRVVDASSVIISATSALSAGATFAIALTGCGPPCGPVVHHGRTVTLKLRGQLTATGQVSVRDGLAECRAAVPVQLQRRHGKRWRTVETGTTTAGGGFRVKLRDRAGSYRAVVAAASVGAGAGLCEDAASRVRRAP